MAAPVPERDCATVRGSSSSLGLEPALELFGLRSSLSLGLLAWPALARPPGGLGSGAVQSASSCGCRLPGSNSCLRHGHESRYLGATVFNVQTRSCPTANTSRYPGYPIVAPHSSAIDYATFAPRACPSGCHASLRCSRFCPPPPRPVPWLRVGRRQRTKGWQKAAGPRPRLKLSLETQQRTEIIFRACACPAPYPAPYPNARRDERTGLGLVCQSVACAAGPVRCSRVAQCRH